MKSGSFDADDQLGDDEQENEEDSIKTEWFGQEEDENNLSNISPSINGPSNISISDTSNLQTPNKEYMDSKSLKKKSTMNSISKKSLRRRMSKRSKISKNGKIKSSPKQLNVIENEFEKLSLIKLQSIEDSNKQNRSRLSVSSKLSSSSVSTDGKNDQIEETKVDFVDNNSKSPSKNKKTSDLN